MAGEPTVRWGSQGDAVADLQTRLTARGYDPGTIDGDFGPRTDAAVRQFQADNGLVADGIVGPMTWGALEPATAPVPTPAPEPAPSPAPPPSQLPEPEVPPSHVVFVEQPLLSGGMLMWKAARVDRAPIAAGSHGDTWYLETDEHAMVGSDTVTVPFVDEPDGVYQVAVHLPDLAPGAYKAQVWLAVTSGLSEIAHAAFTVEEGAPRVDHAHVVFVEDPVVSGGILSYKAGRVDRAPIAAGAHVDSWTVETDANPLVDSGSVTVPFDDAPDGVYQVMVALPDFEPGTYKMQVSLTVTAGASEVGRTTFTV